MERCNGNLSLATELEEVVVTGYGVYDKKRYTGSAVTIDTEPISRKNISNISRGLVGEASGLTVVSDPDNLEQVQQSGLEVKLVL